jgi:hypothetical protein
MKRTLLMTAALTAAAMLMNTNSASADAGEMSYKLAMQQLTPQVASFTEDVESLVSASMAKPELACSAEMAELSLIGASIAADIDGAVAPSLVSFEHGKLVGTLNVLADAAGNACGQADIAAEAVAGVSNEHAGYLNVVKTFTAGEALSF